MKIYSESRYRATAVEQRLYGGKTVTKFTCFPDDSEGFPKESGLFAVQARIPKTNSRNVTLVRWDASKTRDQQIATTWRRAICWFSFCIPSPH